MILRLHDLRPHLERPRAGQALGDRDAQRPACRYAGSIRLISNGAGASAERRIYHPFGEIESWDEDLATTDETKGWIGERFDAGAGLQYLNARYYDPELGLFLQPDWFEVTEPGGGTNRYAYSFNDPVNLVDPNGSWVEDLVIGVPSLMLGMASLNHNLRNGNLGWGIVDSVAIAADAIAIATPGLSGGAGLSIQSGRRIGAAASGPVSVGAARVTGFPQITAKTAAGLDHAATSVMRALEIVKQVGPENVKTVAFHKQVKTTITGSTDGRLPDVMVVTKGGSVTFVEIVSPSQSITSQLAKAGNMEARLVDETGMTVGENIVSRSDPGSGADLDTLLGELREMFDD